MKKLKSQSGRSMVEMLGVLAIIGVLSVGGIAGYSLSMRRHRANGVVDLMSKYALVAYNDCHQKLLNGEISDITRCDFRQGDNLDFLTFSETAVGTLPAGVKPSPDYYVTLSSDGSDTDIIMVSTYFDDDRLCQAVGSIAGSGCSSHSTGKFVIFKFKQN